MLLEIKGLSRGYQRRGKAFWAVNGVDLSIRQGDFVNIIGRSIGVHTARARHAFHSDRF